MTYKNNEQDRRILKEVNDLTLEFKDKAFPTRVRGYSKYLVGSLDGEIICYLCMDIIQGLAILHPYFVPAHRTRKNILICRDMFYEFVHPWCTKQGCDSIMVSCEIDNTKLTGIIKTFGFHPEPIQMAVMPIIKKGS